MAPPGTPRFKLRDFLPGGVAREDVLDKLQRFVDLRFVSDGIDAHIDETIEQIEDRLYADYPISRMQSFEAR